MGAVLTGSRLQQGSMVGGDGSLAGWADGISVDQEIANAIGQSTRFASLQLGIRATGSDVRMRMSYSGPARPLPPQNDPVQVFQQIFSGFMQTPQEADSHPAAQEIGARHGAEAVRHLAPEDQHTRSRQARLSPRDGP